MSEAVLGQFDEMGKFTTIPLMVALEQTHAKMSAIVPVGEVVLVAPKAIADTLGVAIPLNGRRVRIEVTDGDATCVYLMRSEDLEMNRQANA